MANKKYRNFEILLYLDNNIHMDTLKNIIPTFPYVAILHDNDINEDTKELLKPHYHVILMLKNPRYKEPLANQLNIEINLINEIKNIRSFSRYLIHLDNPQKYQYKIEDLQGSLVEEIKKYFNSEITEQIAIIEIIEIIENNSDKPLKEIVKEIANAGLWSYFRRGGTIFMNIINDERYK